MKPRNIGYLVKAGILTTAAMFAGEFIGPTKNRCEKYQGYRNTIDAKVVYVFDSLTADKRKEDPLRLIGDGKLKKTMLNEEAIGKRFCFSYMDPSSPIGKEKVLKTIGSDTSSLEDTLSK